MTQKILLRSYIDSKEEKFHFGQFELTNLVRVLIRSYRFRNQNKDPRAIVFPDVKEVDGVRILYGTETLPTRKTTGKTGSSSS